MMPWADATGADVARGLAGHRRHLLCIELIASETGRPVDEVARVYQDELLRMASRAVVLDYLPVLVSKRVRAIYRHRPDAPRQGDAL